MPEGKELSTLCSELNTMRHNDLHCTYVRSCDILHLYSSGVSIRAGVIAELHVCYV